MGKPEKNERRRFHGFTIVDDTNDDEVDMVQDEQFDIEKQKIKPLMMPTAHCSIKLV